MICKPTDEEQEKLRNNIDAMSELLFRQFCYSDYYAYRILIKEDSCNTTVLSVLFLSLKAYPTLFHLKGTNQIRPVLGLTSRPIS